MSEALKRGDRCPCLLDRAEVSRRGHQGSYNAIPDRRLDGTALVSRLDCGRCYGRGIVTNPMAWAPPPVGMRKPAKHSDNSLAALYHLATTATGKALDDVAALYEVERVTTPVYGVRGRTGHAIEPDAELRARLLEEMGVEPEAPAPTLYESVVAQVKQAQDRRADAVLMAMVAPSPEIEPTMGDRVVAAMMNVPARVVAEKRVQQEAVARKVPHITQAVGTGPRSGKAAALERWAQTAEAEGKTVVRVGVDPAHGESWSAAYPLVNPPQPEPEPERLTTLAAVHACAEALWRERNPLGKVVVDRVSRPRPGVLLRFELGAVWCEVVPPEPLTREGIGDAVDRAWRDVSDTVARGWGR